MKRINSKHGSIYVETAIKIIISLLVGAVLLVGISRMFVNTVLPTTSQKVQNMFNTEFEKLSNLPGAGMGSAGDMFQDGICHLNYYLTLEDAIADANIGSTEHENATAETAGARIDVRQKDGVMVVRPLRDCEIPETQTLAGSYILDINGCTISAGSIGTMFELAENASITVRDSVTTDINDMDASSGQIVMNSNVTEGSVYMFKNLDTTCSLTLLNGRYTVNEAGAGAATGIRLGKTNKFVMKSTSFNANSTDKAAQVLAVKNAESIEISGSSMPASSQKYTACAVNLSGAKNISIEDSVIMARGGLLKTTYGMSIVGATNEVFIKNTSSYGYANALDLSGTGHVVDCCFSGGHSGLQTTGTGTVYIEGGSFESCSHGGVYLAAQNNIVSNINSYLKDFQNLQWYTYTRETWGADTFHPSYPAGTKAGGSYVGNDANREVHVYLNGCTFSGVNPASEYSMVISSNYNYKDTYLYASNTTFEGRIRLDGKNAGNGSCGHYYQGKNVTMGGDVYYITSANASASTYTDEPGVYDNTTYVNTVFDAAKAEEMIAAR